MNSYQMFNKNLKALVKILYDDTTYEIINYIVRQHQQGNSRIIDEQEMAFELNLSYNQVRQSLIVLQSHRIILSQEHKKKKGEEKEELQLNASNLKAIKKNKTSDVYINEDYVPIIDNLFDLLEKKLERKFKEAETQRYKCLQCNEEFTLSDYAHFNKCCKKCITRPPLTEIKAEKKDDIRKKTNEILSKVKEILSASKTDYSLFRKDQLEQGKYLGKKTHDNKQERENDPVKKIIWDPLKRLNFEDINSSYIDLKLSEFQRNEDKWKIFKDLVLNYTNGDLNV